MGLAPVSSETQANEVPIVPECLIYGAAHLLFTSSRVELEQATYHHPPEK